MIDKIDKNRIPQHIAIIMDGNGRWATERGKQRSYGHQAGVESVRKITSECTRLGVKFLTLYTFSTENWNRPADEVAALMGLVLSSLEDEIFMKNNVRFHVIGDMERLPEAVRNKLNETMEHTKGNTAMTMVVALSYSSKWEITRAIRQIAQEAKSGQIDIDDINEDTLSEHLWQIAYSELYFCDTYWPDFDEECLHKAIASYQSRQRRFGMTEEQVENEETK